ncbi:MAG: hypothetical protein ACRDPY_33835 [Streptosporangiaceae bacterium]
MAARSLRAARFQDHFRCAIIPVYGVPAWRRGIAARPGDNGRRIQRLLGHADPHTTTGQRTRALAASPAYRVAALIAPAQQTTLARKENMEQDPEFDRDMGVAASGRFTDLDPVHAQDELRSDFGSRACGYCTGLLGAPAKTWYITYLGHGRVLYCCKICQRKALLEGTTGLHLPVVRLGRRVIL